MLTISEYKDYFVCGMRDLNAAEIPTDVKLIVFKNGIVTAVFWQKSAVMVKIAPKTPKIVSNRCKVL